MKFNRLYVLSILVLLSCNSKHKTLVLKVNYAFGLTNNSTVTFKGNEIGKFKVSVDQSYAEIVMASNSKLPQIPIDSKLKISDFAETGINTEIHPGRSNLFFNSGDTLSWFVSDEEKKLEKTLLLGDSLFVSKNKDKVN